ncbi:MAG: hypothetical protein J6M16_03050 [Clostridia bacterium]|nr:hypothetical protein [Clostridia bacterium]
MKRFDLKILKLLCLMLTIMLVFSGCSATAINDAIMDAVSKDDVVHEYSEPGAFVIEDETESTSDNSASESSADENKQEVENEQEVKERIIRSDDNKETIIKGLNESYPGYVRVNRKDNIECIGTDGTTLTLRSVEIYDSFYGSGLELNSSILEPDGTLNEFCKNMLNISSFILVDMEITYVAPAENEGGDAIFDFNQFVARWIEGDKDPEK